MLSFVEHSHISIFVDFGALLLHVHPAAIKTLSPKSKYTTHVMATTYTDSEHMYHITQMYLQVMNTLNKLNRSLLYHYTKLCIVETLNH